MRQLIGMGLPEDGPAGSEASCVGEGKATAGERFIHAAFTLE